MEFLRKQTTVKIHYLDKWLLLGILLLVIVGLLMVASTSMVIADRQFGMPFHYFMRQCIYVGVGLALAFGVFHVPIHYWQRGGLVLLGVSLVLLVAVIIPGIGREVNGSMRWIGFGFFNLQVSEFVKFSVVIYMAGYLVRHERAVKQDVSGFIRPMILLAFIAALLLKEPDFGAVTVLMLTVLGMLFLAEVKLIHFLLLAACVGLGLVVLAISSPYRMHRLTAFTDPWANPFGQGYQLVQSLIAFGRGGLFGVGLGGSIQKLFYLPEAHTDFIFAIFSEEMGLFAALAVVGIYVCIVWRALCIAKKERGQNRLFTAYIAYGFSIWFAVQCLVNMGVCTGLLPTKGLTLPLLSYGGSSMLVNFMLFAILLRIDYEARH